MKKTVQFLSLLVMVFSYVFAPFSYAYDVEFYKNYKMEWYEELHTYDSYYEPWGNINGKELSEEISFWDINDSVNMDEYTVVYLFWYWRDAENDTWIRYNQADYPSSYVIQQDDVTYKSWDESIKVYATLWRNITIKFYSKMSENTPWSGLDYRVIQTGYVTPDSTNKNVSEPDVPKKYEYYKEHDLAYGYSFDGWFWYSANDVGWDRSSDADISSFWFWYSDLKDKLGDKFTYIIYPKYTSYTGNYVIYSGSNPEYFDIVKSGDSSNYTISTDNKWVIRDEWNFEWWNTRENATWILSSIANVDTGIVLYPIFSKIITINFEGNWNTVSENQKTCKIYSENWTCKIEIPEITPVEWKIVQWYSLSADSHEVVINTGITSIEVWLDNNWNTYYAQSKKDGWDVLNVNFNWNGWKIAWEATTSDLCYTSDVWNTEKPSCTIDVPVITLPEWRTFVWFNRDAKATTNDSAYNPSTKKLTITEDGQTWYLITSVPAPAAGGGSSISNRTTSTDTHNSADTEKIEQPTNDTQVTEEPNNESSDTTSSDESSSPVINEVSEQAVTTENKTTYTDEIIDAYTWAYQRDVTTMETLDKALPDDIMIRGHMAKVVVNYMVNVLGRPMPKEIPAQCSWNDSESDWESAEIKDYAKKACAFGVMGINMDKFLPKKRLSRAEFGTILSRILWWDKYNNGGVDVPFYIEHLAALKEEGLMNDIVNADIRNEQREWIWVALRRTENTKK